MARQISIFPFIGRLGDVIGYMRNGKYFLRSMPKKVRRCLASRRAARRFGIAVRRAALIRKTLYDFLEINFDSSHINRLNKVLITAKDDHALTDFRFNQYTGTDRFFTIAPVFSRDGVLNIPPQTLHQHKNIMTLEVKAIAVRFDFTTGQVTGTDTVIMTIDAQSPFAGATIPLHVPGNGTMTLTLEVAGMLSDGPSNNRQYMAADIIAVIPPPVPKTIKKRTHPKRAVSQSTLPSNLTQHHSSKTHIQRE